MSHDAYQLVTVCGSGEVGLDLVKRCGYVRDVGHSPCELLTQFRVEPNDLGIIIEPNDWIGNVLEKVEAVGGLRLIGEIAETHKAAVIDRPHRPPVLAQMPAIELQMAKQATWIAAKQIS
ncbi:hypothetical protein MBOT_27820 [Mycobacterium botniense]|uniref:Uncharacterized protein n=2 Tax=Mycobacterium botniense TaxID=84962 RepID=A0A7I9Y0B3_9MYCO|nr:hypothetical protein MBOT_27820 [Mycobacterium botniense]